MSLKQAVMRRQRRRAIFGLTSSSANSASSYLTTADVRPLVEISDRGLNEARLQ